MLGIECPGCGVDDSVGKIDGDVSRLVGGTLERARLVQWTWPMEGPAKAGTVR